MNVDIFNSHILRDRLALYKGEFESHITVACDKDQFPFFREQCDIHNGKALIVELNEGDNPTQPMLCKRHPKNVLNTLEDISYIVDALSSNFKVVRVKVEASIHNECIPNSIIEAAELPSDCYFEHHLKVNLPDGFNEEELRKKSKKFNGHLSRNPLNRRSKKQKRFITQRFYSCTSEYSHKKLIELKAYLVQSNYDVIQVIREFNIYDSNVNLDSGWIGDNEPK